MAVRLSTLAEIKVVSLSTYMRDQGQTSESEMSDIVTTSLLQLRQLLGGGDAGTLQSRKNTVVGGSNPLFKTIGLARQVRIDEDFGTQNIYGVGAPTRPRIVPNNYQVNVTAERLQLDTRDLNDYISSPEFWYSDEIQRNVGIDDFMLYTYFFVKSKETQGSSRYDIYALMPKSASKAISSGDVMIAHNAQLIGFKYSYEELYLDATNLINDSVTDEVALTT